MKFRVHIFEELQHSFTISAKDIDEAATKIDEGICANWQRWEASERTGDISNTVVIDPLNEDGEVDYKNRARFTRNDCYVFVKKGVE